jgi:hypothetical protein
MQGKHVRTAAGFVLAGLVALTLGWMAGATATGESVRTGSGDIVGRFAVVQLVHEPVEPSNGSMGTSTSTRIRVTWRGASYNRVATEVFGRVTSVDEHWVVLDDVEDEAASVWIPRERVHVIEAVGEDEMKRRRMTH